MPERNAFVKFLAPWCGHCKALEADWTALASQLSGSSTGVARVDATAHTELAALYQVEGFPSLQFFSGGRVFSYAGERSLSAMLAFAELSGFSVAGELHDRAVYDGAGGPALALRAAEESAFRVRCSSAVVRS